MEKKILVVDDEVMIREMFDNFFSRTEYQVLLAESAEQALKILQKECVMVLFLDINLPGMSGIDLCKKMRTENHPGFIFAITGFIDVYNVIKCRNAGFDDFFGKPFSLTMIFDAAEDAFNKLKRWKINECELL